MERKIDRLEKPVNIEKDDENRDPGGQFPRQHEHKHKCAPCERPVQNFEKAVHEYVSVLNYSTLFDIIHPRPHRLMVRTTPFHGVNRGSIPRGATENSKAALSWLTKNQK